MHQAGLGTVRVGFSWISADPQAPSGDLEWGPTDGIVTAAARNGIQLLPVLYGTPTWVAQLDGDTCYPFCGNYVPRSPKALYAWGRFVRQVERRYGPGGQFWRLHPDLPSDPIHSWQIWNEQNSGQYFAPRPSVRAYGRMLKYAAKPIRSRDRNADIVLGGMFGEPNNGTVLGYTSWDYLRRLYRVPGVKRLFDTVAIHPYSSSLRGMRQQVRRIRDQIARAHDRDARIWITEIGWASGGPPHPLNKGRHGQAVYLRGAYDFFLRHRRAWGIRGVDWFSWRDATGPQLCKWCPDSGLLEAGPGFRTKPAFHALTAITGGS